MRKLTHQELLDRQEKLTQLRLLPLVVVLDNIRSAYNVGSIFRTADGLSIEKLYLCGITSYPPNKQILKTALGSQKSVAWEYVGSVVEAVKGLKAKGFKIILLEQMDDAKNYKEFNLSEPTCLVLGNEVDGINEGILDYCDQALEIPMHGVKNSLNVAVAFGVVGYHLKATYQT